MWWKDGNEDVLPVEGVKEGGDGMDAGSQPAQPLARHDDSSFEERAGKYFHHVPDVHSTVILC